MVVRQREGGVLQRMQKIRKMRESDKVIRDACALISHAAQYDPDTLDWVLRTILPIMEEAKRIYNEHAIADSYRSQRLHIRRGRWGRDDWPDAQFYHYFRFKKEHFVRLTLALNLGADVQIKTRQRLSFTGEEALMVLLYRMAYPGRWISAAGSMFRCQPGHLCDLFLRTLEYIDAYFAQPLSDVLHKIPQARLAYYAQQIQLLTRTGNDTCIGFIDGTFRHHARPHEGQQLCYNGHYRGHGVKYISVSCPDGITPFYFGPVQGRRHDSYVLSLSDLEDKLTALNDHHGSQWHVYGDSAFTLTRVVQTGFRESSNPSNSNALYTYLMNSGRIAVEWGFGRVSNLWKYLDYSKQLRMHSSPLGSAYRVATCLTNMKTCLEGCQTTSYFQCEPPTLEEYISWAI
jgi:hypothetical protein